MSQTQTDLRIFDASGNEIPLPDGSSAFPTMALNPISDQVEFVRTTSGKLINLSDAAFQLYEIGLSANWLDLPAIEQMRLDQEFTIHSTIVLKERGATPSRDAVEGSVVVESGWVEYRPIFYVKLTGKSQSGTEGRDASWSLTFEEVEGIEAGEVVQGIQEAKFSGGTLREWTDDESGTAKVASDFTESGVLTVSKGGFVNYILQGGGGCGGYTSTQGAGGGGGAGQFRMGRIWLPAGEYTVTIGDGGPPSTSGSGAAGSSSIISNGDGVFFEALGGGGGGRAGAADGGGDGASGGGGGWVYENYASGGQAAVGGITGFNGGSTENYQQSNYYRVGAAGGGATKYGSRTKLYSMFGADGGNGMRIKLWNWLDFAGGGAGGGGSGNSTTEGLGALPVYSEGQQIGYSAGGAGAGGGMNEPGVDAVPNSGAGGGGAGFRSSGSAYGGAGAEGRAIFWVDAGV